MLERISGSLLDPESLYLRDDALFHSPELRGLNLVMGFTGFADAGHVVRQITAELLDTLDSGMVAEFDADQLIDYRSRRPQISFVEDHLQDYQAPRLALYRLVDGLGSPFLLLAGFEPDLQWGAVRARRRGHRRGTGRQPVTWIHSIPMPVPYTRPVRGPCTATARTSSRASRCGSPPSRFPPPSATSWNCGSPRLAATSPAT